MTPTQYKAAIKALGMTQHETAVFLGVSIRTANGYANAQPVPLYIAKLLRLCVKMKLRPEDVK